jgi:uncharacterized membrane protein YcaP (DUF421 family)
MSQLLSILRSKGFPKIADVDYAILEPIGEVSIIPKVANTPVTVEHLNISIQDEGLPIAVIVDGRIQQRNLQLLGQTKDWLLEQLRENNLHEKDIMYAYVNEKSKKLNINRRK